MSAIVGHLSLAALPEADKRVKLLRWQALGLQFTASGYGRRIPTAQQIRLHGRWRRVYACVFSNSGTCYVEQGVGWIVITD